MPKVLICASTAVHIRNFHLPYLSFFKKSGFEVHVAVPESAPLDNADILHPVPITKRLVSLKNLDAVFQVRRLVRAEHFDLILVHTTLAAFVVRLGVLFAGKARPPLINTVHGYFFWKDCSLIKRLTYYLPELLLRGVTDGIITMNDEDTAAAQKLVKKDGRVFKVHGMGVDAPRFQPAGDDIKRRTRRELDIPEKAYVLVYAAEFSKRKNHSELINALEEVRKSVQEALLLLCGTGALEKELREDINRRGLSTNVRFMGWCGRMETVYAAADMAVSVSKSEGLPFNIIEAQLCALPVVASCIRGHTDLIRDGENGSLYSPGNSKELADAIMAVWRSPDRGHRLGNAARESALRFSLTEAYRENTEAYMQFINNTKA